MEKFDKDLEEIKTELNNIKLSDDFKNNLKIKMEEELNKSDVKEKARNFLFPRKLVATFACFLLLITSCAAFADEIESFVANIFSNTDRKIEEAIANGNYKEIDMEYVEHDGIGIKVDYIVQEENTLCIAFNVKYEEELKNVYINKMEIRNRDDKIIYKFKDENNVDERKFSIYNKKINNKETCIIYEIYTDDCNTQNLEIIIEDVTIFNKNAKTFKGIWNIYI